MVALERLVFIVFLKAIFLTLALFAKDSFFDSCFSHVQTRPIEFAIIGERCSGTNFIQALISLNISSLPSLYDNKKIGKREEILHKHFIPWLELKNFGHPLLSHQEDISWLSSYQETLFIFVVRNPYDWVRSFYQNPWHVDLERFYLENQRDFFSFLSNEWHVLNKKEPWDESLAYLCDHCNPYTNQPFSNVLELRTYKILNALRLGQIVSNFVFVSYEKVLEDPKGFIDWLSAISFHEPSHSFVDVPTYKGVFDNQLYAPQTYFPFQKHELDFIEKNLDWEVESWIGYKLIR